MTAIIKREIKNYLKRPLFWIGVAVVILGVFQNVTPYLETRYVSSAEELENDLTETVHAGDVYEGYIPTEEAERRTLWEKQVEDTLRSGEGFELPEVEAVMAKIRKMDVDEACLYLENEYQWFGAEYFWEESAYRKGDPGRDQRLSGQKAGRASVFLVFRKEVRRLCGTVHGICRNGPAGGAVLSGYEEEYLRTSPHETGQCLEICDRKSGGRVSGLRDHPGDSEPGVLGSGTDLYQRERI